MHACVIHHQFGSEINNLVVCDLRTYQGIVILSSNSALRDDIPKYKERDGERLLLYIRSHVLQSAKFKWINKCLGCIQVSETPLLY